MTAAIPEKASVLTQLREHGFNVPDFIYLPASDFENRNFAALEDFLAHHRESFKVIARSAHPAEAYFKGGTFDSLETYADIGGIQYARNRMIRSIETVKRLSILRQQAFDGAPELDPQQMGVIVMPFINGSNVMAKKLWDHWEFGYCRERNQKVQREPFITGTPHDRRLLELSEQIQECLGFPCEIEFINGEDGIIHVVQAKDISQIEILDEMESRRSVTLDGLRRIRKRRNYRERPLYVMNTAAFYLDVIGLCEDLVLGGDAPPGDIGDILEHIREHERQMEYFALRNQRFAILGLSIQPPGELQQIANHYLDDTPELQQRLSKTLQDNFYRVDTFIAEADTLVAKDKFRINLCSHDAYGINTVRDPIWTVYWHIAKHRQVMRELRRVGFRTGDTVGIEIDPEGKPTLYRL